MALSAEAMAMHFAEDLLTDERADAHQEGRSWDSHRIGEPAAAGAHAPQHAPAGGRTLPHGALSQTEVGECPGSN